MRKKNVVDKRKQLALKCFGRRKRKRKRLPIGDDLQDSIEWYHDKVEFEKRVRAHEY